MRYANPDAQVWLYLIFVAILFLGIYINKYRKDHSLFAGGELKEHNFALFNFRTVKIKQFLRFAALLLMTFSLMRPQWGFSWQQVSRKGVDIYFAVDVSKSMLAQDIKPDRLTRTKLALKDIVKKIQGDRLGLIAFAGSAFIQCPLTVDYNGFLLSVDSLNTDLIARGGTSLSGAIEEAIKGFKGGLNKYSVLVLITDGEDHEGSSEKLMSKLKELGIRVYGVGIGTREGELIPVEDTNGQKTFLKDKSGKVVKTRLNDNFLKELALQTGGSYIQANSLDFGLEKLYDLKIATLEEREIESRQAKRYEDRYQVFLGLAFFLLLLEIFLNARKEEESND